MAINFPNSPSTGDTHTAAGVEWEYDGEKWVSQASGGGGGASVTVSDTPPASPSQGDLWWDSSDDAGVLFIWYDDDDGGQWVETSGTGQDTALTSLWTRTGTTLEPANAGDGVTVRGSLRSGAADDNVAVIGTSGIVGVYREDASSKACFQTFVATDPSNPTSQIFSDGSASFGDVAGNSSGAGPLGGLTNVRASGGFNVTQVGNQQCSFTHDRIIFNVSDYYVVNSSTVGVRLQSGTTAWVAQSDLRLKTGISEITDGLNKVSQIRGVLGRYKTDEADVSRSMLIAQDVQKVLPQAVGEDSEGFLGIRYTEVIPLLVSALHDAKDRIEALEARLTALEGGN